MKNYTIEVAYETTPGAFSASYKVFDCKASSPRVAMNRCMVGIVSRGICKDSQVCGARILNVC